LVEKSSGVVKDSTEFDSDLQTTLNQGDAYTGYILLDCINGICKRTSGYILVDDTQYAVFEESNTASPIAGVSVSSCEGNIGKVIDSNGGICIKAGGGVSYKDDNKRFIIKSSTGFTGTPFENSTNNAIIKRGIKYIIKDLFYDSKFCFLLIII